MTVAYAIVSGITVVAFLATTIGLVGHLMLLEMIFSFSMIESIQNR